tara:strand:+ start:547 stop:1416 length:870 start_codon:yes stop_codon:yes gene_type:complete
MLITVQLSFIKLFENQEIEIFKYSGLKNSKILSIISLLSLFTGAVVILIFYNLSSNLKNIYLEIKSNYASDGKYLAVVTKNGLWIKDKIDNKIIITNASSIESHFILNNFITEFDEDFNIIRNIKSNKIDIREENWKILNAKVYYKNEYLKNQNFEIKTNFNYKRIKTLYSNLSALNLYELYQLRKNYKKLNYSLIDIDLYFLKIAFYPLYLVLIALFSSLIMLRIKKIKTTAFKISIGLFFSVIIYYLNNFSYVLGGTEKISIVLSTLIPLMILFTINTCMLYKINDK